MDTTTRFGCRLGRRAALSAAGLALVGLLGLAGFGGGCNKPTSLSVPMNFRPKTTLNTNAVAGRLPTGGSAKVYIAPVEDKRSEKQDLIGENLENTNPVPVYPADKKPTEFVRDVIQQDLQASGVQIASDPTAATRIIDVELTRFLVQENPGYKGEVRAMVKVSDPSGRQLFSGPFSGSSSGFGRSLSAENYQEQMSDSVRDLTNGMLNNPNFIQSLGGPSGSTTEK